MALKAHVCLVHEMLAQIWHQKTKNRVPMGGQFNFSSSIQHETSFIPSWTKLLCPCKDLGSHARLVWKWGSTCQHLLNNFIVWSLFLPLDLCMGRREITYIQVESFLCPKDHFKFQTREMKGSRPFQETKSIPSTIRFVCEFWFCRHAICMVSSNT